MRVIVLTLLCTAGCGGVDSGQIKSWSGAITLVANGTWNEPEGTQANQMGTEMLNAKCLLMGTNANVMETYTLDSTLTVTDSSGGSTSTHVTGSIQGSANLTGNAADDACHACLDSNSGAWSIAISTPGSITGTFTTTVAGMSSTQVSTWSGQDPWLLANIDTSASGTMSPGRGSLNGMKTFTPVHGTGDITLTWSVTPE